MSIAFTQAGQKDSRTQAHEVRAFYLVRTDFVTPEDKKKGIEYMPATRKWRPTDRLINGAQRAAPAAPDRVVTAATSAPAV